MIKNQIFFGEEIPFQNHWKNITIEQINEVIPEKFLGKESFINFYTCYNGGDFTEYARFYPNESCDLPEDWTDHKDLKEMNVLGFYEIALPNEEKKSFSIQEIAKSLYEHNESGDSFKKFITTHIPFANDLSSSIYLISVLSGEIKYLDFTEDFFNPENAVTVATSFSDFCKRIKKYNIG